MPVAPVDEVPDTYVIDTGLLGLSGVMSAYLIDADRPTLIDAGAAACADTVLTAIETAGVDPVDLEFIVATHVHLDHAGAAGDLVAACPNATVFVHERGYPYLTEPARLTRLASSARDALGDTAEHYGDPTRVPEDRCRIFTDGDVLDLGDRELTAIDTPGHAPHHLCLYGDDVLFAADAAGTSIAGTLYPTTPPPSFDLDASLDSLARLHELEPTHVCYGHFGTRADGPDAIASYADLLPTWVETVERLGETHDSVDAIVAALDQRWMSPTVNRDVAGVLAARPYD